MPTVTTNEIRASGGDYSTAASWESDSPADLTVSDTIWQGHVGWDGARHAVTSSVSLSGTTTDSTRYKHLTAAPGESWQDLLSTSQLGGIPDGAGFFLNANASAALTVAEDFSVIENLVWNAGTHVSGRLASLSTASDAVIRGCYFRKVASSAASGSLVNVSGLRSFYVNNFHMLGGTSTAEELLELGATSLNDTDAPSVLANTFVVTSTDSGGSAASARGTAIWMNSSNSSRYTRVIGNVFAGVATLFQAGGTGSFSTDSGYNLTTLAAGSTDYTDLFPGSGNMYSGDITGTWSTAGVLFVNTTYSGLDMRASPTGDLVGNSTRIGGSSNLYNPSATDTYTGGTPPERRSGTGDVDGYGNTRSTSVPWLGAWEDPAASGGGILLLRHLMMMKKKR